MEIGALAILRADNGEMQLYRLKEKMNNSNGRMLYRLTNERLAESYFLTREKGIWRSLGDTRAPAELIRQLGKIIEENGG